MGAPETDTPPLVLALDWATAHEDDLLLGRSTECDIQLAHDSVSRRHARLVFRDGTWVIQDLESTNGTIVNGERVGRCQLHPGDRVWLGEQALDID
jgi:pSer/pThr/pTyr-binding forkhead associated (FHA) protein